MARQRLRAARKSGEKKRKASTGPVVTKGRRLRDSSGCRESNNYEMSNQGYDTSTREAAGPSGINKAEMSNRGYDVSTRGAAGPSGSFGWSGPRFLNRSAVQVERMVSAYDRVNGGNGQRLVLKRVHECNGQIKACKFFNINVCNLPEMKVHGQQGEEVEHCCSDCLYVVPGMILRHRAETMDCPIFNCMQNM